jgi:para-nitrobenzyl esterase
MNSKDNPVVTVSSGKIEGVYEDGLYVFRGVPYAAPPVGALRWMPPRPAEPWQGILPVREYGCIAPQNMMATATEVSPVFDGPQNEACLFLNIWTPGLDDARRPVLFWIHGGAFILGAGSEGVVKGGKLARRGDIVMVSINYRLGALGFMNLKEITGGKIPATGNEGLLDQIAALEWVIDNIAAFGGDPDNITVSGFSAGGMSTGTLLGMPLAKGKYQKAMNRSGASNVIVTLENAMEMSGRYLEILGVDRHDADAIRNLSVKKLLDAQQVLGDMIRVSESRATPFIPVLDGEIVPEFPIEAIEKGSARGIPILAGNTLDELKAMNMMDPAVRDMDEAGLVERLDRLLPSDMITKLINIYREVLKKRGSRADNADIWGTISADLMFRISTIRLVEAQRDNGAPAYNYLFTYRTPAMGGVLGAMHGLDSSFLFGNLDPGYTGSGPEVESLATKIQDSCAAFMHTGNPSCESIGEWPVYGTDRMTMILDIDARVEAAPYEEERRAWDGFDLVNTLPL